MSSFQVLGQVQRYIFSIDHLQVQVQRYIFVQIICRFRFRDISPGQIFFRFRFRDISPVWIIYRFKSRDKSLVDPCSFNFQNMSPVDLLQFIGLGIYLQQMSGNIQGQRYIYSRSLVVYRFRGISPVDLLYYIGLEVYLQQISCSLQVQRYISSKSLVLYRVRGISPVDLLQFIGLEVYLQQIFCSLWVQRYISSGSFVVFRFRDIYLINLLLFVFIFKIYWAVFFKFFIYHAFYPLWQGGGRYSLSLSPSIFPIFRLTPHHFLPLFSLILYPHHLPSNPPSPSPCTWVPKSCIGLEQNVNEGRSVLKKPNINLYSINHQKYYIC